LFHDHLRESDAHTYVLFGCRLLLLI